MSSLLKRCLLGVLSALLLNLPFPIAGPVPAWRTAFAFGGAVPLLYALLADSSVWANRYLLRSFFIGWAMGIVWYGFNCYWIYQTMFLYDYERLWLTNSLRGAVQATVTVTVLATPQHSGLASGIVPSSFRILRALLDRIEDSATGAIKLPAMNVEIPADRRPRPRNWPSPTPARRSCSTRWLDGVPTGLRATTSN